jgi:outer membrane protein assembly factor BamB
MNSFHIHRVGRSVVAMLVLLSLPALAPASSRADDWPNWRGPAQDGVAAGSGYATEWGPEKNVLWRTALPGTGASTPAVQGDRVVVTCAIGDRNAVVCFDRDGKEAWRRELGPVRAGKHAKATGCNPSPVTDGVRAWVYYKSGELACLDLADGAVVWRTNLQERFGADTLWWDLGTSPVLAKKAVIVAVMQSGPSYLAAFDRGTGELLWKQDRLLDAPEEAAQSYSTPVVIAGDAAKREPDELVIVLGADHVTAHDAATGKEVWRVGGLNPDGHKFFRSIASPVVAGDYVIAPYARGATLTAVRRGGSGDVTKTHVAWTRKDLGTDVPTPAAAGGRVIVCTDKGTVACLEAATGKTLWSGDLPKNRHTYSASPVLVDGAIVVTREDGASTVLAARDAFEVLGSGAVGETTVATPVCIDGRMLLRTHDSLWCIGKN